MAHSKITKNIRNSCGGAWNSERRIAQYYCKLTPLFFWLTWRFFKSQFVCDETSRLLQSWTLSLKACDLPRGLDSESLMIIGILDEKWTQIWWTMIKHDENSMNNVRWKHDVRNERNHSQTFLGKNKWMGHPKVIIHAASLAKCLSSWSAGRARNARFTVGNLTTSWINWVVQLVQENIYRKLTFEHRGFL